MKKTAIVIVCVLLAILLAEVFLLARGCLKNETADASATAAQPAVSALPQSSPAETASTPQPAGTPAPTATPEPERFPVTEAIAPLPGTVESVDMGENLLLYEAGGITYLYAHGVSVPLYEGKLEGWDYHKHITNGETLTFIEPEDGTLHTVDLSHPDEPPKPLAPESISGAEKFAVSDSGNEALFLKEEAGKNGETVEVLYYYADGTVKRIDASAGKIYQFCLSRDGRIASFYGDDEDGNFSDSVLTDGEITIKTAGSVYVEWVSTDMKEVVLYRFDEGQLILYRDGQEPLLLTETCRSFEITGDDGRYHWIDKNGDGALMCFDGTETQMIVDGGVTWPYITDTGAYAFLGNGMLYAVYAGGTPVRLCSESNFLGARFLADGRTLVYETTKDYKPKSYGAGNNSTLGHTAYAVTVDESGVSEPVKLADGLEEIYVFGDDLIDTHKKTDATLLDLYYHGLLLGTDVTHYFNRNLYIDYDAKRMFFISGGRLYHFDGDTLKDISDIEVEEKETADNESAVRYLDGDRMLYLHDGVLYYYDGASFHRIAEDVVRYQTVWTTEEALVERVWHD